MVGLFEFQKRETKIMRMLQKKNDRRTVRTASETRLGGKVGRKVDKFPIHDTVEFQ
jgi:hypothetical protein